MINIDSTASGDMHERLEFNSFELVALRVGITGAPYRNESVGSEEAMGKLGSFVKQVEKVAKKTRSSLILAPEYSLYFHPAYARPIELKKSELVWQAITGDDAVVGAIDSLSQIAKENDTNIAIGTLCEKDSDTGFLHNTALVIDSKGDIVHRRRKFTGTHWATKPNGEDLETGFLWETRRSSDGRQLWRELVISSEPPEDKEQRTIWELVHGALATIEPFEVMVGGKKLKAALSICAELGSGTEYYLNKLKGENLDIIMRTAYEGDDRLIERTQAFTADRMLQADLLSRWRFNELLQKVVSDRVVKGSGVFLVSDSAINGSAGVFPVSSETKLNEPSIDNECVYSLVKL